MKYIIAACIALMFIRAVPADDEPTSNYLSVPFAFGSETFRPNQVAVEILKTAKYSSMVIINGRTSNMSYSKNDESIALKRAISARKYLVSTGVSPLKIMINYASATDFLADNTTVEGQAINQRVDIKIINIDPRMLKNVPASQESKSVWEIPAPAIPTVDPSRVEISATPEPEIGRTESVEATPNANPNQEEVVPAMPVVDLDSGWTEIVPSADDVLVPVVPINPD